MNAGAGFREVRRRRRCWLAACLVLLAALALFFLMPWSLHTRQSVVLLAIALYAMATLWAVSARCPRCGHLFHNVLGFANPFSRRCAGCSRSLTENH